jgi:hypothetical protein
MTHRPAPDEALEYLAASLRRDHTDGGPIVEAEAKGWGVVVVTFRAPHSGTVGKVLRLLVEDVTPGAAPAGPACHMTGHHPSCQCGGAGGDR